VLASLAGCAGKIRYPNYYVLNVPAAHSANDPARPILGSVAVREFDAPRFLRGGPIVYRDSPARLGFYEYDRWAIDPRHAVTSAVIQQMQSRGISQSVDLFDGRGTPECLLTGAIDHLEEVDEGSNVSVEVSLSARLINVRTGEVVWQGALSQEAKLERRSVPGIVDAMSREIGNVVEGLLSSMQERVSAASASLGRSGTE